MLHDECSSGANHSFTFLSSPEVAKTITGVPPVET